MLVSLGGIVRAGVQAESRARHGVLQRAERMALGTLEATLNSDFAQSAVAVVLRAPFIDALAREAVRSQVVERAIEPFMTSDAVEHLLASAQAAGAPQRIADQMLTSGVADAVAERIATGPELERIVAATIDTPGARRLVAHVIESGVVDEAVTRLLESEQLWLLIDEIARSPAVTDAISHQSMGLADQVADVVRDHSRSADARLERIARRMLRRSPRTDSLGDPTVSPSG